MAELFMECEEEELQPWQRKLKEVVVDDDDDEPIFVGEIVSAKPTSTNNLNRVNPVSSPRGIQNGSPGRGTVATFKSAASSQYKTLPSNAGTMAVTPVFQAASRPATSSVVVQPLSRPLSVSGSPQSLQRPIPGGISLQQTSRSSSGIPPPTCRPVTIPVTTQPVSRNANIPVMAQPGPRPVATVTAQPVNQGYILSSPQIVQNNSPGAMFGVQQKEIKQYPSGPTLSLTGNSSMKENVFSSKRPAASEVSIVPPKISKSSEPVMGKNSSTSPSAKFGTTSPSHLSSSKGTSAISNQMKNGAPFPRACPKCNIHFNLMDPLKNHMKYCCPDMVHTFFLGVVTTECSSAPRYEEGKLIMLVSDFYYGKHDGDLELIQQEQKTHTTFKCFSCAKVLKSNVRFMNHMKHHLELEKQNSESWESHTTCHHCYRQFPTPFQLQCHIESSHTLYESTTICKICELSYDNEQVLLQHMKDNHKPGEMPYVCQVCSYRSSLFSDVESHFRTVHENTKSLLCPFCLKVIRIGTPYMQHYMKHQKKGIYRCAKCRLQFLTSKEKMDHRTQHHRTFKKPKQLEGLPPGTKVTIRASVGSLQAESSSSSTENTNPSTFLTASKTKSANSKNPTPAAKTSTAKSQPSAGQSKKQPSASHSKAQTNPLKKSGVSTSTKKTTIANTALKNLRYNSGANKCIECYSVIKDFASHFPTYNNCSLCRYSTSCSKAYVNHMVSFHSNRPSKRFWIFKKQSKKRRGLTTVCLNCDFLAGDSGLDAMAKHISENHSHSCQIVVENVSVFSSAVEEHLSKSKNETTFGKKQVNSEKHSKPVSFKPENAESVDSSENGSKVNAASLEMRIECNEKEIATDTIEKNEESAAPLKNESDSNVSQKTCSKKQTSEKTSNDADEANDLVVDSQKQQAYDETDVKMQEHLENAVSSDHMNENKIANVDEVDEKKSLKLAPGDVTFEQFLRRDDPESVGSDISDHGSIRLEPLTPSEVLEYEATEILQKGGVSPSTKKAGQTDEFPVGSSPGKAEATISLTDECEAS